MKFKKLSETQIIISIDRLTRFKPTLEKYLRVFSDIISSNLIEPKFKKNEIEQLPFEEIRDYAVEIFNSSLGSHCKDLSINEILKNYENNIFNNTQETNILLDNKLDYQSALKLIKQTDITNLKWLNHIKETNAREKYSLQFPLECIVIAEGITEEILLPKFAQILECDFLKHGIKIMPAGGKNQVVKLYYKMAELLKIPMFVLLDNDAQENAEFINKKLRPIDEVYILNCGEFEDLLPKQLIIKTVNKDLKNFATISEQDFAEYKSTVHALEEIFKEKGLHEFKKAEFAALLKDNITSIDDISPEIKVIMQKIKKLPS